MAETIFDTAFVNITYQPEDKLIIVRWIGKSTSEQYRAAITRALEFASGKDIVNYISDIRDQNIVSPDDRKWFETEAVPAAVEKGLKRAAVIFDGNVFKKYYVNLILKTTNRFALPLKFFNETQHAIEWFRTFS